MDQISQIKQALDIVTVVGSYVNLKKAGKTYKGLCPFHSEKSPSFIVSPELQIYKCFGCGKAGDIFNFVQDIEGVDFTAALEQLASRAGIVLEKAAYDPASTHKKTLLWLNESVAQIYNHVLTSHPAGIPGLNYLKKTRKLSDKTIKDFQLGYAPDLPDFLINFLHKKSVATDTMLQAGVIAKKEEGGYIDKFRGRVVFPFVGIDGKVLGFTGRTIFDRKPKYLNTAETEVFHKSNFIYGMHLAKVAIKTKGAVFVEGQMDVISAHEAGFDNVIASSGTSLTQGQLKLLSRYTNDLIFCFDSDNAGVLASFRGIELAESMGFNIKVCVIPQGYKDLDELIKADKTKAELMLSGAVPAYDYLLFTVIKKYNKDSPDGKKKIVDELVPWFSKLSNPVLIDHYAKELSRELSLNLDTVFGLFKGTAVLSTSDKSQDALSTHAVISRQSVESYIISLLLHSTVEGLDFMRRMTYKVEPYDFTDVSLGKLLTTLQGYLKGNLTNATAFDPNIFESSLNDEQKQLFESLYMQEPEFSLPLDGANLAKELDAALFRLKSRSAKKRMHELSEQIRLAEKSNDLSTVTKLTAEFEELQKQLVAQ